MSSPMLEDHKYLSTLTIVKNKVNIDKIKMNSHKIRSETRHWTILKRHRLKESTILMKQRGLTMKTLSFRMLWVHPH